MLKASPANLQSPANNAAGAGPPPHDSAPKHVAGEAIYIDDMPAPAGLLHAYLGLSDRARAAILSVDLSQVEAAEDVVLVLGPSDIPGINDVSPVGKDDEPVFAAEDIRYHGQPLFAVIARTRDGARRAARLARISYRDEAPIIDIASARAAGGELVTEPLQLRRGEVAAALDAAPRRLQGSMSIGGQDHFYLEGQIALALPGEDDDVTVYSSSQHPGEVQHMVARALGVAANAVTVEVRRMGGAFGGKETQGNLFAVVAALAAKRTGQAVKIRPDRDDDMIITGKRHDFLIDYDVGFDDAGRILALDANLAARCGYAADLSGPVTDRALFHVDNCYYYPAVRLRSQPLRTNTVSNTAFRGFGGPQGMLCAERVIEEIAFATGKDALEIRKANLYGVHGDLTPYHQEITHERATRIIGELEASSDYAARRAAIRSENAGGGVLRRGIALTPVKFGISFTATWYNQAGALVHIYTDGSVHLNHGGTEMGQGLNVKVAQIVAEAFQIELALVQITPTTTGKVPNASATAASSGSDLNGMAALDACDQIKARLERFAREKWGEAPVYERGAVRLGATELGFAQFIDAAYRARVQLSAAGFYKTPDIHWDRQSGRGQPFYYFAYGAAVSEVTIDTLTGEYRVERVDLLHDAGASFNSAIDVGQIEGGFVQGMGWLTTEELWWDDKGRLRTHAPSTYKIPVASDAPRIFNIALLQDAPNEAATIRRSKAVGEPPLMLAISVLHALSDAIASVADYRFCPRLDAPATPERVLEAVERLAQGRA